MITFMVLLSLIGTEISAVLYRAGGMSKDKIAKPTWIPMWMRQSWVRDWLIPFFSLGVLLIWWQPQTDLGWYMLIPSYALMGAAFSTYWDWLFKKDNFFMHGFAIGLSIFPMCFGGFPILGVIIQSVISALAMGFFCKYSSNDVHEEMFRGAVSTLIRVI